MFQLSEEQKISNLEELILQKRQKVERLNSEIKNLEAKKLKLQSKKVNEKRISPTMTGFFGN